MFISLAVIVQTVAIIGAGPSGLTAAKEAQACGLQPTVFEKNSHVGGVWSPGEGKTWDSMRINNSRNGCTFSDHDWESGSEDFPNQKDVYEYLCSYVNAHHLQEVIKLRSTVSKIEKIEDRWLVEWVCDEEHKSSYFDSVIVCSGLYSQSFIPKIPGLESFSGHIIHAQDYKNPSFFRKKRVAIVGNALSGCEIAAEIAQVAEKVFHIYRKPRWILSRYLKEKDSGRKVPFDLSLIRRVSLGAFQELSVVQSYEKLNLQFQSLCHRQHEICAKCIPCSFSSPPFIAISDSYLPNVEAGAILLKEHSIKRIEDDTLYFSDGSILEVDAIVFCTGYRTDLHYLSQELQEQIGYQSEDFYQPLVLYKNVFHPDLPTLAFVGLGRYGINFAIIELQARYACMAFSNKISLPTREILEAGLQKELQIRNEKIKPQYSKGYLTFCDELAKLIGVLPDFEQLQKEHPILYEKLWNGPFTCASYRLVGFGSNPSFALEKIDELYQQVREPLHNPECVYQILR